MSYLDKLNKEQYEAVVTESKYVRVVAGAGSGKTRVLTSRIAYLTSEKEVFVSKILAFTFTNKAAKEMADRAVALVTEIYENPIYPASSLNISTFHSFCAKFLRIECGAIGYPRSFTIYDEDDVSRIEKNIAVDMGKEKGDPFVKEAHKFIKRQKNWGRYPDEVTLNVKRGPNEKDYLEFYARYEQVKEEARALDFDDLILKTTRILENFPEIRERWSNRYEHILVDEYQDTNDTQYKLIRLLMNKDTCLYVVGDPDQTIYTWRGANPTLMMQMDKNYPNVETVKLVENYRSTKTILDTANKLIDKNKERIKKDLFTNGPTGQSVEATYQPNAESEAIWVAKKIVDLSREHKNEFGEPDYSNIAVLFRSSYMTKPFEEQFVRRAIPYRIFGGLRFYERKEVKDLLAYFNLFFNARDNVAFERIVNVPKRGIGQTSIDRMRTEAKSHGLSTYEYMCLIDEYIDETDIPKKAINSVKNLIQIIEDTKAQLDEGTEAIPGIIENFIKTINYKDYLREDEETFEDREENVDALVEDISRFVSENTEAPFSDYLQNISILSAQDDITGDNVVTMMTIHIAKGLEYDNVFIICMNQDAFPSLRSINESGSSAMEEERRLAYVAITRAKKRLFCSCNGGYSYVVGGNTVPSCFFKEAGITIPTSSHTSSSPQRGGYKDFSPKPRTSSYYSDGPHISQFNEKPKEEKKPEKKTNGITDWKLGDKVVHEKFGNGKVIGIVSSTIIRIQFEQEGVKTLLSNHPMLDKAKSEGGDA